MTRPPRISVIVPAHAHLQLLPAALRSIRAQKVEGCEVIVVDDGCATPPDAMVQAIIPDAVVLRQANAGPSAARNRGLRHARGELVTFLDSDDRWADNALARLARASRMRPASTSCRVMSAVSRPAGRSVPAGSGCSVRPFSASMSGR